MGFGGKEQTFSQELADFEDSLGRPREDAGCAAEFTSVDSRACHRLRPPLDAEQSWDGILRTASGEPGEPGEPGVPTLLGA